MSSPVNYAVEDLLPHAAPMILIDAIQSYHDQGLIAEVDLQSQRLFQDSNGLIPAYVGLEYMAQSVSAYIGLCGRAEGKVPSIGLLLGSREYQCETTHFSAEQTLQIEVMADMIDAPFGLFSCQIRNQQQQVLATAQIKAIQPDDIDVLFEH